MHTEKSSSKIRLNSNTIEENKKYQIDDFSDNKSKN
jgi:hypothetical protein